ncbi:hypothetical protein [Actinopolyspora erythraea]|nr:hypothetical protein [Actinopolyspora erythraea]
MDTRHRISRTRYASPGRLGRPAAASWEGAMTTDRGVIDTPFRLF